MPEVLLVQNTRIEGSGYLGTLLDEDGFTMQSIIAKNETIPKKPFSLVVILGAPESANDDLPYLREEQKLIKKCVAENVPVLGVCLGSQLIAKTFGSRVYRGPKKEIGFYHDLEVCNNNPFFNGFQKKFTVFHWHGDTFDLPAGSNLLASSENYQNQAFQYKSAVGLQFHLEVNESMVNLWLDNTEEKLKEIPYIDPKQIRLEINDHIVTVKNNMKLFYENFKTSFNL